MPWCWRTGALCIFIQIIRIISSEIFSQYAACRSEGSLGGGYAPSILQEQAHSSDFLLFFVIAWDYSFSSDGVFKYFG